ncbi:DUF4105 domain-containing protein [Vibrio natriegens]|uniref:lipoprotein N-acyltransferase Lnb domain-containing protein n=1 Tax=Vibrio natriegens TaxID=691 RepID=UPI001FB92031|nr:DUF4105 domain-containing protein [Vibrio natriegens]
MASDRELLEKAIHESITRELAVSKKWLGLIHFEDGVVSSRSSINNSDFFLSPLGYKSPQAELKATLDKFIHSPITQCRFPARVLWLKSVMPNLILPQVHCAEYDSYMKAFRTESVSVLYASGYLGNPASMYGHVLLKFNGSENNDLLDNTFSYGAIVSESDNKLTYIYKGIMGGYQGHFANQKYHHQSLTYNESELRDLWEYRLNLTQDEIDLLLAHLWEIENSSMTYYFFKQNCSYQLAKLLEIVVDRPLLAPNKLWVMPYDLIMMLNQPGVADYIDDFIYHGSRQENLYNRYKQLNDKEKDWVQRIINQSSENTRSLLLSIDEVSAKRIIDTLYDYYSFLDIKNEGLSTEQANKRKQLLLVRFELPPEKIEWEVSKKKPPHAAQNTAKLQVSQLYNESFGQGNILRFRANYYDMLNLNAARIPYSELSTLDISFLYTMEADALRLREFSLFNVVNLNVSQTGLPGDESNAWALKAGYKPTSLDCIDCSDIYLSGFYGKSWLVTDNFVGYSALAGEFQVSDFTNGNWLGGPEFGLVLDITPSWATTFIVGRSYNLISLAESKNYLSWEQRFLESRDFDFRTTVRYDEVFEYAINVSMYW